MEAEKDLDHLHNIDKEQGHASYAKDAVVAKNLDLIHDAAEQPATEAEKRKVLLKIDSIILPILFAVSLLNFIDKATISYANLLGINADLGMTSQEFSNASTYFYVAYLVWQPFAAYCLQRLPLRWHIGGIIVIWGGILCCHGAVQSYSGLAACRFLLGCAESAMVIAFTTICSVWYTRNEQGTRISIWFGAVAVAQIIGGISTYGILKIESPALQRFRIVFLLWGCVTVAVGAVFLVFVPSTMADCWWLSKREKYVALERIADNHTGTVSYSFELGQVKEALRDPRLYCVFFGLFTSGVPNGGVTSFGAIIVKGFGFTTLQSTLVGMSTGASEIVAIVIGVWINRRFKSRFAPAIFVTLVAIVGAIIMIAPPESQRNTRYAGYVLMFFWPIAAVYFLAWMASMVAGHTKRICFLVAYQFGYSGGNICGTQIFQARDAPGYAPAKVGMLVGLSVQALFITAIFVLHVLWNRKRDAELAASGLTIEDEPDDLAFRNKTDYEQKRFRYPY